MNADLETLRGDYASGRRSPTDEVERFLRAADESAWESLAATHPRHFDAIVTCAGISHAGTIAKTSLVVSAYSGSSGVSARAQTVESLTSTQHTTPTVTVGTAGSTLVSYWSDKTSDATGWRSAMRSGRARPCACARC